MKAVSLYVSIFCEFFWLQEMGKTLTTAFSVICGRLIALCVTMATVPKLNTKYQNTSIHANFGHPEVRSFQIPFTNTCVLENCVRPH